MPASKQDGITLIELMVTIAVIAILATIAVPSFQEIIKRNQVAAQTNELIALIHLARNEAIRRNPVGDDFVLVDLFTEGAAWRGAVFPPGETATQEGCPVGAIRCASHTTGELTPSSLELYFNNRGYSVEGNGNLKATVELQLDHKNATSNRHKRCITIFLGGQVESAPGEC